MKALPTVSWLWWLQSEAPQAHPVHQKWWWFSAESWYSSTVTHPYFSMIQLNQKKGQSVWNDLWNCWYRWAIEMFILMTYYLGYSKTLNFSTTPFSWVFGRQSNSDGCIKHHKWYQEVPITGRKDSFLCLWSRAEKKLTQKKAILVWSREHSHVRWRLRG